MAGRGRRERPRARRARLQALLSPLSVPEYRLLWGSQLASTAGDWATRLALAVVVLHRTGSAAMASLVVGASLLAWLGPGQLLSQFADLYGRRLVMVVSDLLRAAVFVVLVLPVPTWALLVGAAVAGLAGPPFSAARAAATRDLVPAPHYGPAMALAALTADAGTVIGYALGGAILAVATPEGALLFNSTTFLLSALLVARLPETHVAADARERTSSAIRGGVDAVFQQPLVRMAVVVGVLAAASGVGIEALVVVYNVRELHGPAWVPGVLLAGVAASSFVITALLPNSGRRNGLLRAAATTSVVGAVVAAGGFLTGSPVGAVVAILASGAFYAVLSPANVVVGPLLPSAVRASAFSVLMGVLVICQSLGASVAGALADRLTTPYAAALICLPAFAGGAWILRTQHPPIGWSDDIEAPLEIDLEARLSGALPPAGLPGLATGPGALAERPRGRHAAPYHVDSGPPAPPPHLAPGYGTLTPERAGEYSTPELSTG